MEESIFLGIKLKDWAWIMGGLITLIGLIKGLMEFSKANRIKRAEFLEKLILEFNDPKMFLAKRLLDDFWIETEGEVSDLDVDLLKAGSIEKKEKEELRGLVKNLLRNHADKSVTGNGEHRARQSFDDLLDFFTKLDYYLSLRLISKSELTYFHYYFQRCAYKADGAVLNYAAIYGYPSLFRLLYVLNIDPKNKELYKTHLKFSDKSQRVYYHELRY
ncbi:MAG: hypothetical protein ABIN97_18155 [Ginsengibacter sp.]